MSKLLLIDDEEGIRKVLSISLKSDGYDVITAGDGHEGLKLFQEELFPIVLTDIKMPGLDGIEVLRRVKEINPDVEVIVITGHGDMEFAIRSVQLGASDFITKPVSDQDLSIALKRAEKRLEIKKMLKEYTSELENMVKEATEEVKRRYEFENKLIQRSIDGIIATDKEGNIVIFNPAAEKIFGYTENGAKSTKKAGDLYPEVIMQKIADVFSGKKQGADDIFVGEETSVVAKDGEAVPVRCSGAILYEVDKPIGSVGFFQDLRELKRLQEELITSERLAAVGQTVAGLAHCIKNILNGLKGGVYIVNTVLKQGGAELVERGAPPPPQDLIFLEDRSLLRMMDVESERKHRHSQLRTGWDMVERNIDKVSDLVLDLLSYSKEREPEYEEYDPNIIADEVCDLMESKATEYDIKLIRDVDKEIGKVYIDPKGIHRCLLNLVSNAIDACIFDSNTGKDFQVKITTLRGKEDGVVFEVIDNGCGMDEEVRSRIFTEFFSTKGARGTGLGLLVTQKIVEEHGGTMDIESNPGKGTRFTIRLPQK
jgi:two-component system NtrC family sensor kinase